MVEEIVKGKMLVLSEPVSFGSPKKLDRLEIEVTKRCPLKCIHCSVSASNKIIPNELKMHEIRRLISEFSYIGGRQLVLTGGEPLAKGKEFIMDLLQEAASHNMSSLIYTSGYLIDESFIKALEGKDVTMCVSIEGVERTHNKIAGVRNSYRRAVNTLKLCQKYGIQTIINFTPMRINYRELPNIMAAAKEFNVELVKIFNFSVQGRGLDNMRFLKLSAKERRETVRMIREVLERKSVQIDIGGEIQGLNTRCSVGEKIVVTSDGDVVPCLGLRSNSAFVVGNIRRHSLSDLFTRINKIRSDKCICSSSKKPPTGKA
jgi:MoaA/NifB/PqqE/SkfB family radical SAM enzyme